MRQDEDVVSYITARLMDDLDSGCKCLVTSLSLMKGMDAGWMVGGLKYIVE